MHGRREEEDPSELKSEIKLNAESLQALMKLVEGRRFFGNGSSSA